MNEMTIEYIDFYIIEFVVIRKFYDMIRTVFFDFVPKKQNSQKNSGDYYEK